jgi:hypothetical protein
MLSGVVGWVFLSTLTANADDLNTKAPPSIFAPAVDGISTKAADAYAKAVDAYAKAPPYTKETPSIFAPAVDGFNAKVEGLGGYENNKPLYGSHGAFALPLGYQYGAQVDGAAGSFDGRFFGNVGGHLFWRNPTQGLLGVYTDYTHYDSRVGGVNVGRAAAEGEYYLGRWTLSAITGVEFGNSVTGIVGSEIQSYNIKTRFFDAATVAYYLNPNFQVYAGHRFQGGKHSGALGAEWGFSAGRGIMGSLFAEGRLGSETNRGIFGGLKFYFGQHDKTLIRRHREDDPGFVPSSINTINNSGTTSSVPGAHPQSENGP